jgi:hypothetical protein
MNQQPDVRLLLDEMFSPAIAAELCERGLPGHQRFQEQQLVGDGQHIRGRQVPGAAQRGEPVGLGPEQVRSRAVDDLADRGLALFARGPR